MFAHCIDLVAIVTKAQNKKKNLGVGPNPILYFFVFHESLGKARVAIVACESAPAPGSKRVYNPNP
jgi:hypothetical protein